MNPADIDSLVRRSLARIAAEERAFADTVEAGDVVTWSEWVWSRSITGDARDPEDSAPTEFTGTVATVTRTARGVTVNIDPASVTPGPDTVRQRPRCSLPASAFKRKVKS